MKIDPKNIHRQTFDGGINTVASARSMQPNESKYILNCNSVSTAAGNVGVITNIKGNVEVETSLPDGENLCIGKAVDEESNNFYFAVWNSNGYHTWYRFNDIQKRVTIVIQSKRDSNGIDILKFDRDHLILMADVVDNNLLYWVDGLNPARKLNIKKCLDKSISGYGVTILEEYITAYKLAPVYAPAPEYFTDTTKAFNRVYGKLYRFTHRLIYDDGEKSNWSEFSNVATPAKELFTGVGAIPTDNNGILIPVSTGSRIVKAIEIAMQSTDSEVIDGVKQWVSIAMLNKQELSISDDSTYDYRFFNDGSYPITDIKKIIRPYCYLPKDPLCQSFVSNAMTYSNFWEGFSKVDIFTSFTVDYADLFVDPGTVNSLNSPSITNTSFTYNWVSGDSLFGGGRGRRNSTNTLVIGNDVKAGNKFQLYGKNGGGDNLYYAYTATLYDTAITIANQLKSQLLSSLGERVMSMSDNSIDGGGNVSFTIQLRGLWGEGATKFTGNVNPVTVNSLKDTGQSIKNIKLGSSIKLGIEYEDFFGRKSLVYTVDALVVNISPINDLAGFKTPTISLSIKHRPPVWAKYYQIVRSRDLTYDKYLQILVQKVIDIAATNADNGEYLDLSIGSLFTYQKIHENAVLRYNFTKGDRVRLLQKTSDDSFYPFYETEILSYKETSTQHKNENLTIATATPDQVTIDGATSTDNIGSFISVGGYERQIIDVVDGTHYRIDKPIAIIDGEATQKFVYYELINRNGVLRIKKPSTAVIAELQDFSTVELYTPAATGDVSGSKTFYEFGKKFPIINAGTATRAHAANGQDQDGTDDTTIITTPAIVKINEGTAYVRNRELPTSNMVPGAQVDVMTIEDQGYSDFYESDLNDNGRITAQDNGDGEVYFGERTRYSNNFVEDTRINGLNDFDNLDRKDYNDQYGNIMLTKFGENRLYIFKTLKTCWTPVNATILQDAEGVEFLSSTTKLLNELRYFTWEGGVGNNPESYASNGNQKYFASVNSGIIARIGGDGVTPVSAIYNLDNKMREYLLAASKYGAKIYGEFDRKVGYMLSIGQYIAYVYNEGFSSNQWVYYDSLISLLSEIEIVTPPSHGDVVVGGVSYEYIYTPDADYVGADSFSYRVKPPGGEWSSPKNICITVTPNPNILIGNEIQTADFTRDNCNPGYHGSTEPYTIAANTFYDSTQQDANNKAIVALNQGGQDFANATGTCDLNAPIAFTFIDQSGLALSTLTESNEISVPGPLAGSTGVFRIVVTGGAEYNINGSGWTSATGVVNSGDLLKLRNTTSASNDTTVATTVTLGSVSDEWTIRTESAGGLAWRVQAASKTCGTCELAGYVFYTTLEEYTVSTGINTGNTKANDSGDPDYIGPVYDTEECPLPGVTQYMLVSYSSTDRPEACGGTIPLPGSPPISVYSSESNPLTNKTLFNQAELISAWTSVPNNGDYVKFYVAGIPGTTYVGNVDSSGNMTSIVTC